MSNSDVEVRPDPDDPVRPDKVAFAREVLVGGDLADTLFADRPVHPELAKDLGIESKIPLNCNDHQRGQKSGAY